MTTKDYCLSLNDKQESFAESSCNNIHYNNLNLNHNNGHLSEATVCSKSFTNDDRKIENNDFKNSTDSQKNKECLSMEKLRKDLPSLFLEQVYPGEKENCRKESGYKEKNSSKSNNSTLSLHIAAYEKSVEGISDSNENVVTKKNKEQKGLNKKWKTSKQLLKDSTSNIKNSFEYPRQQKENDAIDPEVMQFKASQKLISLSKVTLPLGQLIEIFNTSPGQLRSNWRNSILQATNCSHFISSPRVLRNVAALQKQVKQARIRTKAADFLTTTIEVGDLTQWQIESGQLAFNESFENSEEKETSVSSPILETVDDKYKNETVDNGILEKIKKFEQEVEQERQRREKAEEENSKLLECMKLSDQKISDLNYRYEVQLRRTCEMHDRLNKKEDKERQLLEEIGQKNFLITEISQQKDTVISELMGKMTISDKKIEELEASSSKKDEKIEELTKSMEAMCKKLDRVRDLNHKKTQKLNSKGVSGKSTPRKRVKEVNAPIEKKKAKLDVMEDGRGYSFFFMILCVQLSWLGISDTKIVKALHLITSYLTIDMPRIPDRRTIGRWCLEFSILIDEQLDKLLGDASDLTLHSDETTLSSDKLQAFVFCKMVNGVRKYFVAGMEHVPDKSAARSLKALIQRLKRTIKPLETLDDDTVKEILTERLGKIKNVVSDRASTQKKFNVDLWKAILSLIPGTPKLNEIFCHHHILASSWDVFIKSCLNDERFKFNCPASNFSTLQAAVQFISSNYGERSNAPAKAKQWNAWAAKKGYKNTAFPSKYGSRWNIGPAICSRLLYNKTPFMEFLKETNYIIEDSHSAIVKVLECPAFLVQLQIGAWIDQIINGPWWKEMDSDKHIIELNLESAKIIEYLEQVAEDPTLFNNDEIFPMKNERSPKQVAFRDTVLKNVKAAFFETLPHFCTDLAEYLKKQLDSVLGDEFINDESNRDILASASVSNKVAEQVFGMATDIRHNSSKKSIGRIAANVMGVKNDTVGYIKNLDSTELEKLRQSFKSAKSRHRLQRIEDKKLLDKEISQNYEAHQEKQRKKKKKNVEVNFDKYVGQDFKEIWGEAKILYSGTITRKRDDGYEAYYPEYDQYDILSCNELKELLSSKKIIFSD